MNTTKNEILSEYQIEDGILFMSEGFHASLNQDKKYVLRVKDLPADEKPRERLLSRGPAVLSMAELLAVVLQMGTKKEGVLTLSNRIMKEYGETNILTERDPKKLA